MSRSRYVVERVLQRLGLDAHRRGREWWLRCVSPEHEDKNPSFTVRDEPGSPKHGLVRCYSCKFKGTIEDVVALTLGFQGTDWDKFQAARAWLDGDAAPEALPQSTVVRSTGPAQVVFRLPEEAVFGPLESWVTPARAFAESRGI